MKNLLIGFLALSAFSAFATDVCIVNMPNASTRISSVNCSDEKLQSEILYKYEKGTKTYVHYMKHLLENGYELKNESGGGSFFLFIKKDLQP